MAETTGQAASKDDDLADFKEILREQRERQGRLRHVQQFLTSPLFYDLRDRPVEVSDPPEVIEERKRDVEYRIHVLESLLSLLREERGLLDRTLSAGADPEPEVEPEIEPQAEPGVGPGADAAQTADPFDELFAAAEAEAKPPSTPT